MGKVFGAPGVVDEFEGLFGVHLCWFSFPCRRSGRGREDPRIHDGSENGNLEVR